jgi:hypothetical protein
MPYWWRGYPRFSTVGAATGQWTAPSGVGGQKPAILRVLPQANPMICVVFPASTARPAIHYASSAFIHGRARQTDQSGGTGSYGRRGNIRRHQQMSRICKLQPVTAPSCISFGWKHLAFTEIHGAVLLEVAKNIRSDFLNSRDFDVDVAPAETYTLMCSMHAEGSGHLITVHPPGLIPGRLRIVRILVVVRKPRLRRGEDTDADSPLLCSRWPTAASAVGAKAHGR